MIISNIDDIRRLVRTERKRRGLTQEAAAGLIGHTQKWLSDFERGKAVPPADMALRMLSILGVVIEARSPDTSSTQHDGDEIDIDKGIE